MTGSDKVTPETLKALADGEDSPVPAEIVSLLSQIPEQATVS